MGEEAMSVEPLDRFAARFPGVELIHSSRAGKRLGVALALAGAALGALLAPGLASAVGPNTNCPSFRVLHNDRIGPARLPAGNYTLTPDTSSDITCATAAARFLRFLTDYDGVLPRPWRVVAQGSGKATFVRGSNGSFSVARSGGSGGGRTHILGRLCNRPYTVNDSSNIGPLSFPRGRYLLYIPPQSSVGCGRASVFFTRFLAAPRGVLPSPWRLKNQTATFFERPRPITSAFRVEPFAGAGPA
jgi:hypothetical protein